MRTRQIRVRGRVQGVGYRDALRTRAERLGIAGWVRNRNDGSVEALLQGDAQAVARLIAWARHGPPSARVDSLEEHEPQAGLDRAYAGFERWPSA
jgi:acylphosphatase